MALASISWNPRPPRPGGVVAIYQACSGRGSLGLLSLFVTTSLIKCLVMLLIVLVKVVE